MDRNIYRFEVNDEARAVDPLATLRILHSFPEVNVEIDSKLIEAGKQPMAAQAQGRLIAASREAFSLEAFNAETETGVLDEEVWTVLNDFCNWVGALKKNTNKPRTSPKRSAPPVSEPLTTKRQSACI